MYVDKKKEGWEKGQKGGRNEERKPPPTIQNIILLITMLPNILLPVQTRPNPTIILPILPPPMLTPTPPMHTPHTAPRAKRLETTFSGYHPRAHGRIYALRALPPPRFRPFERLEVGFVLGRDGTPVFEGGHFFSRLVHVGVEVFGFFAFDELGVVVGAAGEGAAEARAEGHGGAMQVGVGRRGEYV